MADFSKPYDPKEVEGRIYESWLKSGYFNPDKLGKRSKKFTVMLPPPNVTGTLHMGHALNAVGTDILVRYKRMKGFKTLWLPGTDHAGIATQNVVEKQLRKEGVSRHDLGREKFLERVWEWKEQYGNIILGQLKRIGASADWSRTRFTVDEEYVKAIQESFLHYYKKGYIYRGERVVNWCPRCWTSLSDLEIDHEETKSKLYFIKYSLADGAKASDGKDYIVVATTRPETMLGDSAVAVNPKDKRFKDLVGKKVILPIQNRIIPIVADRVIDMEFGTGAVKVTPAHDATDFDISTRHNLEKIRIIDDRGRMTPEAGSICINAEGKYMKASECREIVVAKLQEIESMEKVEDYVHSASKCSRCSTIIEPIISKQWFLKMEKLAQHAIKVIKSKKVAFNPKRWEKVYLNWLANIKDWCISRQIWWGHQLPVWFCKDNQTETGEELFVVTDKKPKKCPFCKKCEMEQSQDVLDTWFSSALWPFATLGWPNKKSKDYVNFYPTQFLSTARDILNLWVSRMIFSGMEFTGKAPFKDVYIHATVLTKDGRRMSKSLGTGIDPIELIEKYGADATRFGLIYQAMGGQDIRFNEDILVTGKKFCNKIWNASRFVLMQLENIKGVSVKDISKLNPKTSEDKKIINRTKSVLKSIEKDIDGYKFGQAAHTMYDFFWHDFCDVYIEYAKLKDDTNTKEILISVLSASLKAMHPFIPFATEEIYSSLPGKNKSLLIVEDWPAK